MTDTWKKFKQGAPEAFEALYNLYVDDLFNYGCRLTHDTVLLKDSIHDVFVELWKYRKTIVDVQNPKYYLLKSLRNKLFSNSKVVPLYTNNQFDDIFEKPSDELADRLLLSEEQHKWNKKIINKLMNNLTARQKEAIHLHFYHGFTYLEMTSLMQMNYQSILNLMQRALKALKQEAVQIKHA